MGYSTHILRHHITTTFNESISAGCLGEVDAGTRTSTKGDHILQVLQAITVRIARSKHDVSNILLNLLVDIHLTNHTAGLQNLISRRHRCHHRHLACNVLADNLLLFIERRIVNDHLQHKTVYLCLGQRIGTLLLDGVLGSHHEEWIRQMESLTANGYLLLLHGFEQGTLHLGWSTVDFICQYEVGENRTLLHLELLVFLRIDHRSDDIGREKVGRELNTAII